MTSQEGRPYCTRAGMYLVEKNKNQNLLNQCRECNAIRFIGCPGFKHREDTCDRDANTWARWWYLNEPIADDFDATLPDKGAHRVILPKS